MKKTLEKPGIPLSTLLTRDTGLTLGDIQLLVLSKHVVGSNLMVIQGDDLVPKTTWKDLQPKDRPDRDAGVPGAPREKALALHLLGEGHPGVDAG